MLFPELARTGTAVRDLTLLASSLAAKRLDLQIDLQTSFKDPGHAFTALIERRVQGKAVLVID